MRKGDAEHEYRYFRYPEIVEKLKEAGMPEGQAKAIAEAQVEALSESATSTLATRTDWVELKIDVIKKK